MNIRVFHDRWLANGALVEPSIIDMRSTNLNFHALLRNDCKEWNMEMLQYCALSSQSIIEVIWTPIFNISAMHDEIIWRPDMHGEYSVRSTYNRCLNELVGSAALRVEANWKVLWKMIVLPEVRNVICGQRCAIAYQYVLDYWQMNHD